MERERIFLEAISEFAAFFVIVEPLPALQVAVSEDRSFAPHTLRAEGAEVVGVVTVVDRQEGAGEAFAAAGLTLTPILTLADFKG